MPSSRVVHAVAADYTVTGTEFLVVVAQEYSS